MTNKTQAKEIIELYQFCHFCFPSDHLVSLWLLGYLGHNSCAYWVRRIRRTDSVGNQRFHCSAVARLPSNISSKNHLDRLPLQSFCDKRHQFTGDSTINDEREESSDGHENHPGNFFTTVYTNSYSKRYTAVWFVC